MTAYEYLNALRETLGVLPDEERANAIRYYEDYFLDAGPENEQRVIAELGTPEEVAQQILNDYKEVVRAAPSGSGSTDGPSHSGGGPFQAEEPDTPPRGFPAGPAFPPRQRSLLESILLVCGALFFGIFLGVPLLAAAAAVVISLAAAALSVIAGLLAAAAVVLVVVPVGLLVSGLLLCVFSLFLRGELWSALATFGAGICLLSLGALAAIGSLKFCSSAFRPLLRAGGWCVERCGAFFRWCADIVHRFLERLRGF